MTAAFGPPSVSARNKPVVLAKEYNMKTIYRILAGALGAGLAMNAAAATPAPLAADAIPAKTEVQVPTPAREPAETGKVAQRGAAVLGTAVSTAKLSGETGKGDSVSYEARLNGVVSGNSATNVATGANTIDTGSFANMTGLPVVIQNTGANVLIQSSTIVNVQFR